MNKNVLLCFTLFFLAFAIPSFASPTIKEISIVADDNYYYDNFDNYGCDQQWCNNSMTDMNSTASNWIENMGNWTIYNNTDENGNTSYVYFHNETAGAEYEVALYKGRNFTDFTMTFKAKKIAPGRSPFFYIRSDDTAGGCGNSYCIQYIGGSYWTIQTGSSQLVTSNAFVPANNVWYWYKTMANGTTITFSYSTDGSDYTQLLTVDDSTRTSGYVGFGGISGEGYYDDILIQEHNTNTTNATGVGGIILSDRNLTTTFRYNNNTAKQGEVVVSYYRNGSLVYTTPNATASWNFDGLDANDTSVFCAKNGVCHDGIVTNAIHVPNGRYGWGYKFDGTGDYITVTDEANLNITTSGSISLWAKFNSMTGDQNLIGKCTSNGLSKSCNYQIWHDDGSNKIYLSIGDGSTAKTVTGDGFQTDTWYHLVGIFNNTNLSLYVNGVLNSSVVNNVIITDNVAPVRIGRWVNGLDFNGILDEIYIYNKTLTENEIENIYKNRYTLNANYTGNRETWQANVSVATVNQSYFTYLSPVTTVYQLWPLLSNAITLSASPLWIVGENVDSTVSCSSTYGTTSLTKDGVSVSSPYTARLPFGAYVFNCTSYEDGNWSTATAQNTLTVQSGGFGCTNATTYAFNKTITTTADVYTTLNFTSLVANKLVRDDLRDVFLTDSTVTASINLTAGQYMQVNSSNVTKFSVAWGNYISNQTYPNSTLDGVLNNLTTYNEANPYYAITYYDEVSGSEVLPQNANITVSFYCSLGTSNFDILESNRTRILVPTFDSSADELRTTVTYSPTDSYSRNIIFSSNVEFRNVYLVDADSYQVAQMLLTLDDQTLGKLYTGSTLRIQKNIEGTLESMTEHIFDAENKAIVYLISGDKYQIYVDNGDTVRSIGFLYVDPVDLTKSIVVAGINALSHQGINFNYTLEYINATGVFYFAVSDVDGQISKASILIYNYTTLNKTLGALLYNASSTNTSASDFTFAVPNQTGAYWVNWHVQHNVWGNNSMGGDEIFDLGPFIIPFPFAFPFTGTLPIAWSTMVTTFMMIGGALMFGARSSKAGFIVLILFGSLLFIWEWWTISLTVVAVAVIILAFDKMTEKKVEA